MTQALRRSAAALAAIVFSFSVAVLVLWVPPNVDEFLPYQPLACGAGLALPHQDSFSTCTAYPIQYPGLSYFRSFPYLGIASSLFYQPAYHLFPSPLSHYALGVLVLVAFALLAARAFSLRPETALVPLLYFPLLFQSVHDTGPIRLALLSYPVTVMLAAAMASPRCSAAQRLLAAAVLFAVALVATEDKPFYIYLIPQILLIALSQALASGKAAARTSSDMALLLAPLAIMAAAAAVVLLAGRVPAPGGGGDTTYLAGLLAFKTKMFSMPAELNFILVYLAAPIAFTSRIYDVTPNAFAVSALAFLPVLLIAIRALLREGRTGSLLLAALVMPALLFLLMRNTWSGHHFIFLHVPLVIALMYHAGKSARNLAVTLALLAAVSLLSFAQLRSLQVLERSDSGRAALLAWLSRPEVAANSIINFSDWGGHYIQRLYGSPEQIVTYTESLGQQQATDLEALRIASGRLRIVNACLDCSEAGIGSLFPGQTTSVVRFPGTSWMAVVVQPR